MMKVDRMWNEISESYLVDFDDRIKDKFHGKENIVMASLKKHIAHALRDGGKPPTVLRAQGVLVKMNGKIIAGPFP